MPVIDCTTGEVRDEMPEEIAAAAPTDAQRWSSVRAQRNELLAASDWTQLSDAPVDDLAWAVYRQALRDITLQPDPSAIIWPTAPVSA